ncbi:hypothetical protein X801_00400 [Opisthorchis viverrini]|uniref:SKI-interacting protein SKIP SNW domain-containing protein n=1 Tax=Opisthorchis viverrini TaxID=6198 RepID=A0A1S8XAF2_OPIVI|nr:hypothetical protein X801_00400 [Opisthorchis viverrini]
MGQQKTSSNALVLKTDQEGRIRYDELVRQGHSKDRIIYSKFTDLLPKTIDDNDEDLRKPSQDVIEEMRAQIERKVAQKQKERKEEQLQRIAHHAREFRAGLRRPGLQPDEELDADLGLDDREELRRDRARERIRERNLARSNIETKARAQKDKERDISEQIALGLPNPRVNADGEAQFDQRLFNQSRGLDSGFSGGTDDLYNVYDKPWLGDSELASHIYRPRQKDSDAYGTDLDALQKTRRFVPDREFAGADHGRRLDGPVQFERDEEDPFNLSKFLSEAKKAQKRPGENISADVSNRDTTHRKRERRD